MMRHASCQKPILGLGHSMVFSATRKTTMNLVELLWNDYFAALFEPYRIEDLIPAHVVVQHRGGGIWLRGRISNTTMSTVCSW